MRERWLVASVALAVFGCGGNASNRDALGDDPPASAGSGGSAAASGGAGGAPALASELRFERIAAGRRRFCGVTRGDNRLVCVSEGRIETDKKGPYLDVALSEDTLPWSYLCAVLATGELECEGYDFPLPPGPFERVSVGFFNACAHGPAGAACWIDYEGGIEAPANVGSDFTVEMYTYCHRPAPLHAECYSRGVSLLPVYAHYLDAVAAPQAGCVALLASPAGLIPDPVEPELVELATKSQVVCFTESGFETKLVGEFSSLDVDVDRQGCAIRSDGAVECWGSHAEGVPVRDVEALQVAVSGTLSCILWKDGEVSCW